MMKLYCTYDKVAMRFEAPAPFVSEAVAIRAFKNIVDNENSFTGLNYRDFELSYVGEFDEKTGLIIPVPSTFVVSGLDIKGEKDDTTQNCTGC